MKALISGASGFVGQNLIEQFKDSSLELFGLYREPSLSNSSSINIVNCDLSDSKRVYQIISEIKPDFVIHTAAIGTSLNSRDMYQRMLDINIQGAFTLGEASKEQGVKKFINIASAAELDLSHGDIDEDTRFRPYNFYGATKAATSIIFENLFKGSETQFFNLRAFGLYGPFDSKERLLPLIARACLNDEEVLLNDPQQKRDFLYIKDFVEVIEKVLRSNVTPGLYHIASGKSVTILQLAELVQSLYPGLKVRFKEELPESEEKLDRLDINIDKAQKELLFCPQTSLEKGLEKTISWFRKEFSKENVNQN